MRFTGVGIPQGAAITGAYVQFKVDEPDSEITNLVIEAEAVDTAPVFTTQNGDISTRARTSAQVNWSPGPWLTIGEAGLEQRIPDISAIIQEVVNRSGWVSGNAVVVIITGSGVRTAESYDGDSGGAPLLHVEYTEGELPTPTGTPTFTVTPTRTATVAVSATFTNTATAQLTPTQTSTATWTPPATSTPTTTPVPSHTPTFTATLSPTITPTPTAIDPGTILFEDNFDRPDNPIVGNDWVEFEADGAEVRLSGNRLCFVDSSDFTNLPGVQHSMSEIVSGKIVWDFDFDWQRAGNEGQYRLFMQLGNNNLMNNQDQDAGIGVNLMWTRLSGTNELLVYRNAGSNYPIRVISGLVKLTIDASLDTYLFDLYVDGVLLQGGIPFDHELSLNSVRIFTDALNERNFSGRCFDNLRLMRGSTGGIETSVASSVPFIPAVWMTDISDLKAAGGLVSGHSSK
jgi:hypothetical protein